MTSLPGNSLPKIHSSCSEREFRLCHALFNECLLSTTGCLPKTAFLWFTFNTVPTVMYPKYYKIWLYDWWLIIDIIDCSCLAYFDANIYTLKPKLTAFLLNECLLSITGCIPKTAFLWFTFKLYPKLYIPSSINAQMNLLLLLFLGRLGSQGSGENFCDFAKVSRFWG